MLINRRSISMRRLLSAGVVLAVAVALQVALPMPAWGDSYDAEQEMKAEWQSNYRNLLREANRLRLSAIAVRENYSRAQRRNYPRGGARQAMLVEAEKADQGLIEVEAQIEQFRLDGRRAGALPGWFYEVEDEPLDAPQPASRAGTEEPSPEDREGRNPLYLDRE